MSWFKASFVLLVALFLAGCASTSGSAPSTSDTRSGDSATAVGRSVPGSKGEGQLPARSYEPSVPVIVTRNSSSLPAGCRPRQVAGLITNFFAAFNEGDKDKLSRFFVSYSPTPGLYGISEDRASRGFYTHDREELLEYFAKRHEQGERLQLLKVEVGKSWRSGTGDIGYVITREADDLESGLGGPHRVAQGKGAINCEKQKIFVWNMTMEKAAYDERAVSPYYGSCEAPRGWEPGKAVLACARG